jgi:hypothetical protein
MERNDGTTAICVARMKNISTDLVCIDNVILRGGTCFYAMTSRCGISASINFLLHAEKRFRWVSVSLFNARLYCTSSTGY